jgi:succinate-semialdehyde dehydrogenase / glutarate-semialdehyde dehydrogenase
MPWNYPFFLVFRFAAPALMAGNVCLLKHAPNVPQCALAIEDIFLRAGFPIGVVQTLFVVTENVEQLLDDRRVVAATLTGGVEAGRHVAVAAAKRIKKVVLELGSNDPFIVMPSADLEDVVGRAVGARIVNNGQSCIAAKRFIVAQPVAEEFERGFVESMQKLRVGDPMNESTELGPLATSSVLNTLDRQVRESIVAGSRALVVGAKSSDHHRGVENDPSHVTSHRMSHCMGYFNPGGRCARKIVSGVNESLAISDIPGAPHLRPQY